MKAFKVVTTDYPGNVTGDDEVWLHEDAARYHEILEKKRGHVAANSEQSARVKFEVVDIEGYDNLRAIVDQEKCLVGRVVHNLRHDTLDALIRAHALSKLDKDERRVLGLDP